MYVYINKHSIWDSSLFIHTTYTSRVIPIHWCFNMECRWKQEPIGLLLMKIKKLSVRSCVCKCMANSHNSFFNNFEVRMHRIMYYNCMTHVCSTALQQLHSAYDIILVSFLLNQVRTGLWLARAWFLRIAFVRKCLYVCVCVRPRG